MRQLGRATVNTWQGQAILRAPKDALKLHKSFNEEMEGPRARREADIDEYYDDEEERIGLTGFQ